MSQLSHPDTWLDRYGNTLYRHALLRLNNPALAEEMVQETFLAALQARSSFAGKSSEKSWLIGILKHKIVDHLRKVSREQTADYRGYLEDLPAQNFDELGRWRIDISAWSDPDRALQGEQLRKVLEMCLSRLPERFYHMFILKEIDGLKSTEICKILNISTTNNLWVMLSRTRMQLRRCLDIHWFNKK